MTQPLRPITHPGQSDTLVHFCGRARPSFAPEVVFLPPEERLSNIVAEGRLRAHATPGATVPVVCFSESDPQGVAAMLARVGFAGWGVVVHRQWAWNQGGGPVWYARSDNWNRLRDSLDPDLMAWVVRTSPGDADWLHEREWRVPCPSGALNLHASGVVAFLVSDPNWEPPMVLDLVIDPTTGDLAMGEVTPRIATQVPRWHWNGASLKELPPLPIREEVLPVQP